jgi:cytochrome c biogenesis protein CcdA/thiol-disulfide isomerase/thioredoxin
VLFLLGIAFVAGLITAISPCVLPVLPIVLAGSASGGRRRPFALIGGLVASFSVFTLFGVWILDQLGLPDDLLRNIGIALLFVVAAMLLVPQLGVLIERPLARLGRRPASDLGGGFVLGVSLGPVFVPCAGPVLGAITTNASRLDFGSRTLLITLAYAVGVAVPMLVIAVAGQQAVARAAVAKRRLARIRPVLGAMIGVAALLIALGFDIRLARHVPGYTLSAQNAIEASSHARKELTKLTSSQGGAARAATIPGLDDFGPAPDFSGISHWLNTPGDRPLSLRSLRGKVVLVDFWTYSCINCLRTLPYLRSWYRTYGKDGLVIVGVHTPEFAFEHVLSNVRKATHQLDVRYPVALDNGYDTWNAYRNQYWPAEYLIDRRGHIRHAHFGEGEYDKTEGLIRRLLAERVQRLPAALNLPDRTPSGLMTAETYLGAERGRYPQTDVRAGKFTRYKLPFQVEQNEVALGGSWRVEPERAVAGPRAELVLNFVARRVHLVLGGHGTVDIRLDGTHVKRVRVTEGKLYTLVSQPKLEGGALLLRFSPGVEAYAFTFG